MKKVRIGVLMGGKSREREVSFNSGRTICDHLDPFYFDVIPLFQTERSLLYLLPWKFLYRGKISDFEHRLTSDATLISWDTLSHFVDFMYIAQHGRYAEDGTLQGFLELLGIPYHGSKVFASAVGMDKSMQKVFLRNAGIAVAHDIVVQPFEVQHDHTRIIERMRKAGISFPCIVKPCKEGSSFGVALVQDERHLSNALINAMSVSDKFQAVLIEEKIEGMEFSCIVVHDPQIDQLIALPPTEIVKQSPQDIFTYEQKYMPGKSLQRTPAQCSADQLNEIKKVSLKTAHALDFCTLARIDGFLSNTGHVIITDPNSFSGAAPSSFMFKQAAEIGMNHTQFINHIIKTELRAHYMNNVHTNYTQESLPSPTHKLRVAVIMGGTSHEREISLESGRNVTYKLSPHKYDVLPLFLDKQLTLHRLNSRMLVCNSTAEVQEYCSQETLVAWQDLPNLVDFVFIALHGGPGENGCVQGALEVLGLAYNGSSVFTSSLCMDKYKTNLFLRAQGFAVPEHMFITKDRWRKEQQNVLDEVTGKLAFPCIVKPHDDGCSTFVNKAHDLLCLTEAIDSIIDHDKPGVLVEECVQGMELTGGVIGNEQAYALPPSRTIAQHSVLSIEEKFLPGAGENQTPAPLTQEQLMLVRSTLENVYQVLGARGYARIDCFFQHAHENPTNTERVVILEVNTLPALTPATCLFHQAGEVGIKPPDLIDMIVHLGLQEHASFKFDNMKKFIENPSYYMLEQWLPMIRDYRFTTHTPLK